jgi:DHA2 family methylenomycin A resistance protein-like MFS transporter
MSADAGYLSLLPGMVVIPAGIGLAVPLMTSSLLSTVPRSRSGVASGRSTRCNRQAGLSVLLCSARCWQQAAWPARR